MSINLPGLLNVLRQSSPYLTLLNELSNGRSSVPFNAVRSARPFVLAALANDWPGAVVYLTTEVRRAYNVSEQLPVWIDQPERLYRLAEPSALFYDRAPWDAVVIRNRIDTLAALSDGNAVRPPIIVSSARALMQVSMPPALFHDSTQEWAVGDRQPLDAMIRLWMGMGYEQATIVVEPGTFSRRGGILDIFPLASEYPVRIEFFDDEIDSLRLFDPSDQRSIKRLQRIRIVPAREALPRMMEHVGKLLSERWKTNAGDETEHYSIATDIESLQSGMAFPFLEHYLPYAYPKPASFLDYLPDGSLIVIEDPQALESAIEELAAHAEENRADAISSNQVDPNHPKPYLTWDTLLRQISQRHHVALSNFAEVGKEGIFLPGRRYGGQLRTMLNQVRQYRKRGDRTVIITEQVERLENLWYEQDASSYIPTVQSLDDAPAASSLAFVRGTMAEGWSLQAPGGTLHCVTDAEIFGWARPEPRRRRETSAKRGRKTPETSFMDWAEGTYVVHVDYGIGKFAGMRHRTINTTEREFLLIEYNGTDTLFVPIHQADRLSRFVGADETPPKLNKLGKQELWLKIREKARRNAKEEAKELLGIYRKRARASGYSFSPDSAWQHEMEANFPFVETEDQVRVIQEVKTDMQQRTPMDRLVCGDVGFGKTEVALRAAFKAVQDGMQVAVLVPTTILAQQHYDNFKSRLSAFPVVVEMLSRFRNKGQQREIADRIASGEVDIIIGTHRLLSADIGFNHIGLMIIDEEQRFGVRHKEHFKNLRARIDILTLTATPIPRTLYLSLSGIRDISMIQTPPEERLPVITQVGSWDNKLARLAIMRELERGGQVFVVHNRVKSIHSIRNRIERLVPEATLAVAHGQMAPRTLESVMSEFSRGEYDILVSTAIIENGIDIPRVNTLIVDRADHFGVAQLYQLRGRVGRSAQQAYAYFFHATGALTQEARERLETLSENTKLGSGFQVAIRDLELRGSGDILSTRQSGNIESVGLHLYTDMLQQAIKDQKSGSAPDLADPEPASSRERIVIDLPLPAYIPTDWIPEMALRLQLYRRIANIHSVEDVNAMRQELVDRFGHLPTAVDGLLYQIEIKVLAQAIHATHVMQPRAHVLIKLPFLATVKRDLLALALGRGIEVTRTDVRFSADQDTWQSRLLELLRDLQDKLDLLAGPKLRGIPITRVLD